MNYWTIICQIVPILVLVYFYFRNKFSYWTKRSVPGPQPWIPFGNLWSYARTGQVKLEKDWYRKYGKFYGYFQGVKPVLTVADPELIKQVLVKDFGSFVNRDIIPFDHEIWNTNIFNAYDEQWRRVRAITSPSFSTGKLKGMHALMVRAVDKLADYFEYMYVEYMYVAKSNDGKFNAKQVITGFTLDVIASTSFATETNANGDMTNENPFLINATGLVNFGILQIISFYVMPAWYNKLMGYSVGFEDKKFNFFVNLSKEIIKQRKIERDSGKQTIKRNDLVQLMMDAFVYEEDLNEVNYDKLAASAEEKDEKGRIESNEKSNKKTLTENEIIAQCILFFVAGFETTASTISNSLYHLALNPEIQIQFRNELNSILEGLNENSDEYLEKVSSQIPYLDAVIKETLRIAPPLTRLQRRANVDGYKLAGVQLENDQQVDIAVYAVHHSADYYLEPEQFNPDRFMPENKDNLVPYTYLPFGHGPRNCIGMRFAYQEMKLCLAKIVRQFQFEPTPETEIPLNYAKMDLLSVSNIPLKVKIL